MFRYSYYSKYFLNKKYNSQNNFILKSQKNIPFIEKVQIQMSFKDVFFKKSNYIPYIIYLMEFFSNQKVMYGFSKSDVSFWRLRKKDLVSIFVTLRNQSIIIFLEKIVTFYIPKIMINDEKQIISHKNYISFDIKDFQIFNEINTEIFKIQESKLDISKVNFKVIIVFNTFNRDNKFNCLRDYQIPF